MEIVARSLLNQSVAPYCDRRHSHNTQRHNKELKATDESAPDSARPLLLWATRKYTGLTLREIGAAAGGLATREVSSGDLVSEGAGVDGDCQ